MKKINISAPLFRYVVHKQGFLVAYQESMDKPKAGLFFIDAQNLAGVQVHDKTFQQLTPFKDDVILQELGSVSQDFGNLYLFGKEPYLEGNFNTCLHPVLWNTYQTISELKSLEPYETNRYSIDSSFEKHTFSENILRSALQDGQRYFTCKVPQRYHVLIECYDVNNHILLWQVDPSPIGFRYPYGPDQPKPNYLNIPTPMNPFMSFNDFLIVSMRGNQLIAFYKTDGAVAWVYDDYDVQAERAILFDNLIYAINSDSLIVLNPANGKLIHKVSYREVMGDQYVFEGNQFHPVGDIFVDEQVIMMVGFSVPRRILVLDRKNLRFIGTANMENYLLGSFDGNNAIWHDNTLMYIDGQRQIHTFVNY